MKKGLSFWDVLAWVALASIVVWVILKMIGVINTPSFLEYYPILAASYAFGWQMHRLFIVGENVQDLKKFRNETINEINQIKLNCVKNHK